MSFIRQIIIAFSLLLALPISASAQTPGADREKEILTQLQWAANRAEFELTLKTLTEGLDGYAAMKEARDGYFGALTAIDTDPEAQSQGLKNKYNSAGEEWTTFVPTPATVGAGETPHPKGWIKDLIDKGAAGPIADADERAAFAHDVKRAFMGDNYEAFGAAMDQGLEESQAAVDAAPEQIRASGQGVLDSGRTLQQLLTAQLEDDAGKAAAAALGADCVKLPVFANLDMAGAQAASLRQSIADLDANNTALEQYLANLKVDDPATHDFDWDARQKIMDGIMKDLGLFYLEDNEVEAGSALWVDAKVELRSADNDPAGRFWVTVVPKDAADDVVGTGDRITHTFALDGKDSIRHKAPMTPGEYEVVIHAHHPTDPATGKPQIGYRNVLQRFPLTVTEQVPPKATLAATEVSVGDNVEVNFEDKVYSPNYDRTWITVIKQGDDPATTIGNDLYAQGKGYRNIANDTQNRSIPAPDAPGDYILVVHTHLVKNGDMNPVLELPFTVKAATTN